MGKPKRAKIDLKGWTWGFENIENKEVRAFLNKISSDAAQVMWREILRDEWVSDPYLEWDKKQKCWRITTLLDMAPKHRFDGPSLQSLLDDAVGGKDGNSKNGSLSWGLFEYDEPEARGAALLQLFREYIEIIEYQLSPAFERPKTPT